jgi:hypothetical protein
MVRVKERGRKKGRKGNNARYINKTNTASRAAGEASEREIL